MQPVTLSEAQRKKIERACCIVQGLSDLLLPEVAASVAPFGPLLNPASTALEFGCPLRPLEGKQEVELNPQQVEWLKESAELTQALLRVAAASPNYASVALILSIVSEDLDSI